MKKTRHTPPRVSSITAKFLWLVLLWAVRLPAVADNPPDPVASQAVSFAAATQPTNSPALYTRTFQVDPSSFVPVLETAGGLTTTNNHNLQESMGKLRQGGLVSELPTTSNHNLQESVRAFFASVGADLQPPKAVYFNDRQGRLFVRASLADLDIIEQAVQVLTAQAPLVNIRARFVEVPEGQVAGLLGRMQTTTTTTNEKGAITCILSAPQTKAVLKALEDTMGVDLLEAPDVTTVSGREAQLELVDIRTIVARTAPLVTNGITTNRSQPAAMPFGPLVNVIPYVASDGYTVEMAILPMVTEFLGYEDPASLTNQAGLVPVTTLGQLPLPRFRVRQMTTSAVVWDGQTIVIAGFLTETVRRQTDGTETRQRDTQPQKKHLIVFITPTIVDPAGNRVHADDERPFSTNAVPRQPGR